MSTRRLPPGHNPFRPLRCRDITLLLLLAMLAVAGGITAAVMTAMS